MCIHINIYLNNFAVHQKLTQHCKSTILQLKKNENRHLVRSKTFCAFKFSLSDQECVYSAS